MDIRSCLDRIIAIQRSLSITSPIAATIKRAYKYFPPQEAPLETPCFQNAWTLVSEERGGGVRRQRYTVRMQLLVDDADQERAADIATAFHVALVDAFDADVTLAQTCSHQSLRGGSPTLVVFERAGRFYVGLDLYLDIEMDEAKAFS